MDSFSRYEVPGIANSACSSMIHILTTLRCSDVTGSLISKCMTGKFHKITVWSAAGAGRWYWFSDEGEMDSKGAELSIREMGVLLFFFSWLKAELELEAASPNPTLSPLFYTLYLGNVGTWTLRKEIFSCLFWAHRAYSSLDDIFWLRTVATLKFCGSKSYKKLSVMLLSYCRKEAKEMPGFPSKNEPPLLARACGLRGDIALCVLLLPVSVG